MHAIRSTLLCLAVALPVLTASAPARAQFQPTTVFFLGTAPAMPVAGQTFLLEIVSGPCESLTGDVNGAIVSPLVGNTLTISIPGGSDLACSLPSGVVTNYRIQAPSQPGPYRVEVWMSDFLNRPGIPAELIGARDLTVVAASFAEARPIPSSGGAALVGLILSLIGVAVWRLRGRA